MSAGEEGIADRRDSLLGSSSGLQDWIWSLTDWLFPAQPELKSIAFRLALFVAVGVLLSVIYLAIVPPRYSANAVIGPTQEQFASTPSSQLDRNALSLLSGGGLLSGPRVITPYDAFLKTMQTREVAQRLYDDPSVRAMLFPGLWDAKTKTWKDKFSIRALILAPLYWITGRTYPQRPTVDTVEDILNTRIGLSMIDRGPMYSLTFAATNREFGVTFLQKVFTTTDEIVKDKERKQVLQRIQSLKQRMNSLDVVDYRSQFVNLVMDQEKQLMVLQGNSDFAASMIIAPNAPTYPDSPRLFVTVIIFMVLFFLLGASTMVMVYRDQLGRRLRRSS